MAKLKIIAADWIGYKGKKQTQKKKQEQDQINATNSVAWLVWKKKELMLVANQSKKSRITGTIEGTSSVWTCGVHVTIMAAVVLTFIDV